MFPDVSSGTAAASPLTEPQPKVVLELGAFAQGAVYAFRFTATAVPLASGAGTVSSFADITVVVNTPPTTGTFKASPASGEVLITDFVLACAGWVDDPDDLPLRYSFTTAIDGVGVIGCTRVHA